MPKELEKELKKRARQLHLNGKRKSAYIFGTMQRMKKKHGSR